MESLKSELDRIFRADHRVLMKHLKSQTRLTQDVEEVMQESYLKLLLQPDLVVDNVHAYLYRTAKNISINFSRKTSTRNTLQNIWVRPDGIDHLSPARILESEQRMEKIRTRVREMSSPQRELFELVYYREMELEDACKVLNLSQRKGYRYLKRAIEACRKIDRS